MLQKKIISFVCLCVIGFFLNSNIARAQTTPQATTQTPGSSVIGGLDGKIDFTGSSYKPITKGLFPEDGISDTEGDGVSNVINLILKIFIALAGALAVVMIIVHGLRYMGSSSVWGKGESKSQVTNALIGLVLLLTSYLILYTINPDLVNIKIGINKIKNNGSKGWEFDELKTLKTTEADIIRYNKTSGTTFKRTQFYDKIKNDIANTNYPDYRKLPHCIAQVAIQRESGGGFNVVGHDENSPDSGIFSRREFISSGKKFSGTTFTPNDSLITKSNLLNDDHGTGSIYTAKNPNADDLGLDWRFSHGIGLKQMTFAGTTKQVEEYGLPLYTEGMKTRITNQKMTIKDMLIPEKAIMAGNELLTYIFNKKCIGDVENTFRAYGGGGCQGNSSSRKEAAIRKAMYDQCVAQDK